MIVYHAVTQRSMWVGQELLLDAEHPTGVFTRVQEKMPVVEAILRDPSAYSGKMLEHHTAVALRELAMEEVRQKKYPAYPSRLHCLYVTQDCASAKEWAQYFISLGRRVYQVVKLEVQGSIFCGDAARCFAGTSDWKENLRLAELYWQHPPRQGEEKEIPEILASGKMKVLEIMESYPE